MLASSGLLGRYDQNLPFNMSIKRDISHQTFLYNLINIFIMSSLSHVHKRKR